MRSEIETLLADAQRGWKGLHCSREFADRLQAILDADDAEPERIALYCPNCVAAIDRPAQAEQVGNRVTPADVNADCWPPAPPMHDYEESHDQPGYVCGIHNLFHVDGCPECEAGLPGKEDDNDAR